uniref:BHLH domain-containing protein n=1 Tax=Salix viminalis TaxID=40686 RepID=A0A6N2N931_SALVM
MSFIFFCIFMIWDLYSEADGKNSDKANAIRSKHSVTEQKRRSKINELKGDVNREFDQSVNINVRCFFIIKQRMHLIKNSGYQSKIHFLLNYLIPHSDQKRDTASFLLEVIEYVQYLQEKVQKYEGPYPGWSPEPAKLMPWKQPLAPSKYCWSPSSYYKWF